MTFFEYNAFSKVGTEIEKNKAREE